MTVSATDRVTPPAVAEIVTIVAGAGTYPFANQRFTVSVADFSTSPSFAEMVTTVGDFGRLVDTVNCPLVAPGGTVMLLGTAAILG